MALKWYAKLYIHTDYDYGNCEQGLKEYTKRKLVGGWV